MVREMEVSLVMQPERVKALIDGENSRIILMSTDYLQAAVDSHREIVKLRQELCDINTQFLFDSFIFI
jgi:hypothetical protein